MSEYNKGEIKKIILVIFVLMILLAGIVYIRFQQKIALEKAIKQPPKETVNVEEIEPVEPTLTLFPVSGVYVINVDIQNPKVNDTVTAQINFIAEGKVLDGTDVVLKFDPMMLKAENIKTGEFFSNYPIENIDNTKGIIKLSAFSSQKNIPMVNPSTLFTLKFVALRTGTTVVSFDFEKGKTNRTTLVEKGSSKNILSEAKSATLNIE